MLYFAYWFNDELLTSNTNIHYIYFTDEVVYAGKTPYDHFDFEVDADGQPMAMSELPDDIKGEDQPNLCIALAEAMDWFDNTNDLTQDLLYYIPTTTVNNAALADCRDDADNDKLLDDVSVFALRFWDDADLSLFEAEYGDLQYCEYTFRRTYTPSEGNAPDSRYFVNLLSEFICADAADLTLGMFIFYISEERNGQFLIFFVFGKWTLRIYVFLFFGFLDLLFAACLH